MRIAIFVESAPTDGGTFQQVMSTVELLARDEVKRHEFVVFTPVETTRQLLETRYGIKAVRFSSRFIRHIDFLSSTWLGEALLRRLRRLGLRRLGRHLDALLDDHQMDLALFTDVTETTLRIGDHPMITTVMDLDHVDHPDYPEHFSAREFELREGILRAVLPRSIAVIANSQSGADRIARLYHVDPARIIKLPFIPSNAVRRHAAIPGAVARSGDKTTAAVIVKYRLPQRYVFYPAYYLAHKNHFYLLEALVDLQRRFAIDMHIVFCGADPRGEKALLEQQVKVLGLVERVHLLGFLPDEDIPAIYAGALAVVCPSPFGPTNLQPVEAVAIGTPVICADLPGCREQLGDAALYCDLADPASLAAQVASLMRDPELAGRLQTAGHALADTLASMEYGERLAKCLDDYAYIRRRWAWPDDRLAR